MTGRRSTRLAQLHVAESPKKTRPQRRCTRKPIIIYNVDELETIYIDDTSTSDLIQALEASTKTSNPSTPKPTKKETKPTSPSSLLQNLSLFSPKKPITDNNQEYQSVIEKSPRKRNLSEEKTIKTPRKAQLKDHSNHTTPPKLRKTDDEESNDENIPANPPPTPSTLFDKLNINIENKAESRKKLFSDAISDPFKSATQALNSRYPSEMPGRQKELNELRDFITNHIENETAGSLYISGPPGTGKTASLNLILENEIVCNGIKHIYVNCTTIKSSGAIFARIASELGIKAAGKSERHSIEAIEKYLWHKKHHTILLVLDEIDQLESRNQSVLYTIFEWPSKPISKLILIGIANALDLTDRVLPRLHASCELKPKLMHFAPYTKQQIVEIITTRLKKADVLDVFSPVAIQMLAGKVASISGDIRRALNVGRRVIELVQQGNKSDNLLKSIENLAAEEGGKEEAQRKTVELTQVVSVLNQVYGSSGQALEEENTFPLQQKIVICTLILILKKARNKDVTIGRLHEVYRRICQKRNIQVVDQSDFTGLCDLIETRGIIRIIKKKDARMSKIALIWDESEVRNAFKDKQLMSAILEDNDNLIRKL